MTKLSNQLIKELNLHGNQLRASHSQRFFKTGPGEYGEGDQFIGVTMPQLRAVCKNYREATLIDLQTLLNSPIHEHRMAAVIIMSDTYGKKDPSAKQELYNLYINNVSNRRINNWDLVDVSAKNIVGAHLVNKPRDILYELAESDNVWARRVAILSTPSFFVHGDTKDVLALSELLLKDNHDLIQKAVGWMLREVGKYVDEAVLTNFLDQHASEMPRTMLRYSIERLSQQKRHYYMGISKE